MPSKQQLWNNVYRVVLPKLGFEFNNLNAESLGLKISFDIEKDLSKEPNKAKLEIYNLSDETRKKLEQADTEIELYAGYKDNGGAIKIFAGNTSQCYSHDEGADVKTEMRIKDGKVAMRDTVVSLSYPPSSSAGSIITNISSQMGLPLVYGKGVTPTAYRDGYSFAGNATDALDEICAGQGFTWSVQNGVLQVIRAGSVVANQGIVFSPSSGLLGSPARIVDASSQEDEETSEREYLRRDGKENTDKKAGWEIDTLLFPTVNPGDAVKLESRVIKGWFRVDSVRHEGTSYGGDWRSHFKLIEGLDTGAGESTDTESEDDEEVEDDEE